MFALELAGVSKRYGRRQVLSDVDLSLAPGEALGLLGPNGAGKTTALRLLLGHTTPSDGTVRLRGLLPSDPNSRVGVAFLPERLTLPSRASVRSFLNHPGRLAELSGFALTLKHESQLAFLFYLIACARFYQLYRG